MTVELVLEIGVLSVEYTTGPVVGRLLYHLYIWGKVGYIRTSGKFGHTFANSVNPDETAPYEPFHQDFHCLLSQFNFYSNI